MPWAVFNIYLPKSEKGLIPDSLLVRIAILLTMIESNLNREIISRLSTGKPLDDLRLPLCDGRLDLRGLTFPEAVKGAEQHKHDLSNKLGRLRIFSRQISPEELVTVKGAKWNNLDFTGSKLGHLRVFSSQISNCKFDKCQISSLRIWSTSFAICSFTGANLSGAVLGGVDKGKYNTYLDVDFSSANLSKTIYEAASFKQCLFRHAKLEKIDFQSSSFVDCEFEGELNDVLFYRHGFKGEAFPPNEMVNVDFSGAKLHHVGFRGITLDRVTLPSDDEHIIVSDYSDTIDKFAPLLEQEQDRETAKLLVGFLNIDREWIPPHVPYVLNLRDLEESVSFEAVEMLHRAMGRLAQ